MDVVYRLQGIEFEWDDSKAQQNIEKHGIAFGEAAEAFFDPFYQYGNNMSQPDVPSDIQIRPRASTSRAINIPIDTLKSLEEVAASRDMSIEALLKFYIGQGLRSDLSQRFADRVLDLTAQVLAQHGQSQEQVDSIVREIRRATGS